MQLAVLFAKLRARPAFENVASHLGSSPVAPVLLLVTILCGLAYCRSLSLPFISDDYVQIDLAREFGPVSGWSSLAADALYRCRATSLVLTYWTERLFGLDSGVFNISSLLLHILNCWLVFALGFWRVIGWRVSAVAACYFAVCQQHQEAVMWYAALPELLVFCFAILSFLLWVQWLQKPGRNWKFYVGSLVCFILALLSKESAVAVIGLLVLATLLEGRALWKRIPWILPFAGLGILYFFMAFDARKTHLHFNDGTFSLHAPFWLVIMRSTLRLFGVWSTLSLVALLWWRDWKRKRKTILIVAAAWIGITLLPYSFLTYMPYVPSRHTYFATVGLTFVISAGILSFAERANQHSWAIRTVAIMIVVQHCVYLWTKKYDQFVERAAPTERLVEFAKSAPDTIYVRCFPYDKSVAELALEFRIDSSVRPALVFSKSEGPGSDAINLCTSSIH